MKCIHTVACGLTIMLLFPLAGMIYGGDAPDRPRETPTPLTFYPKGKEPPPLKQKNAKPAQLFQSPCMKSVMLADYAIQMTIDTDKRLDTNASGKGANWSSTSSSGSVKYIPRISIAAKNNPLPESCLLVIEYFSQEPSSKSKSRRECVEHIILPDVGKGQALIVDARGVEFYIWEHKSKNMRGHNFKQSGGLELYGVIVSLFKDDKLLIQMCMPQSLGKECTYTIPSPQAYEDSQSRRYWGW